VDVGKQMLEHLGYRVVVRTSSVEALELFRNQPEKFDLVITDMTMPNLTGDKLACEMMRIRPGIPIILCTGFSEHITEEKVKKMGIRELAMKPLVMADLAERVRRALDWEKKRGLNTVRILVVEDDDQVRTMLKQMMEEKGNEVLEAPNGRVALKLQQERPAKLMITDIIMPEKEGLETIMEFRRTFPTVKIIAISGGGRIGPAEYLYSAKVLGADRTLSKPFHMQELLNAIQELFSSSCLEDR
jgi:CheY-like chemotaxis protein